MDWSLLDAEPGPALERALLAAPRDRDAWQVFADFVSTHSPRLGERIMLELARDDCDASERDALTRRVREFDRQHRHEWLDPGLRRLFDRRGKAPTGVDLDWRYGLILGLRLAGGLHHDRPPLDHALGAVIASPVSRFMARVSVDTGTRPQREREGLLATIRAARPRPALTELRYRDRHGVTPVHDMLPWAPRLERLEVAGNLAIEQLRHANLRALSLTMHEPLHGSPRALHLPRLESLTVTWRMPADALDDLLGMLEALLRSASLPALAHLRVEAEAVADAVLVMIVELELLKQLQVLELPNGGLSDGGAALVQAAGIRGELESLQRLCADGHRLTEAGLRAIPARLRDTL